MKQVAQSYRTGKLTLADVAAPGRAPSGGILVDTSVSLISAGTERAIVTLARKSLVEKARERPDLVKKVVDRAKREGVLAALEAVRAKLDSPIPLGYSLAGRVADVGAGAEGFARGDRVACAGAGFADHAEVNAVPKNLAVHVPDAVSDEEAAFVTVGAIALHGVRLARPTLGDVVVVIGLGLIGQIAVQLLAAHGCDVVGVDVDRAKVDRALARGAKAGAVSGVDDAAEAVRSLSRGYGADAIVITASAPTNEPLALAGELARDRARVSIVGLLPLEIPRKAFYEKELEVVVSRSYGPGRYDAEYEERGRDYPIGYVRWTERRNLQAVLGAIASGRLDVKGLVTHRFAFESALDAYALITGERPEPHLGVLLTYAPREESPRPSGAASPSPAAPRARALTTLGIAVVGTGAFATGVLLPALDKTPGVRLVRTVSGRGLNARHAADKFGAEGVAASLDEVLALPEVEAVVVATRHDTHAAIAARALGAGRDVFLEKPAAVDEEQLAALGAAVRAARRRRALDGRLQPAVRAVCARGERSLRGAPGRAGHQRADQRGEDPGRALGGGRRRGGRARRRRGVPLRGSLVVLGGRPADAGQRARHRPRRRVGEGGQPGHRAVVRRRERGDAPLQRDGRREREQGALRASVRGEGRGDRQLALARGHGAGQDEDDPRAEGRQGARRRGAGVRRGVPDGPGEPDRVGKPGGDEPGDVRDREGVAGGGFGGGGVSELRGQRQEFGRSSLGARVSRSSEDRERQIVLHSPLLPSMGIRRRAKGSYVHGRKPKDSSWRWSAASSNP